MDTQTNPRIEFVVQHLRRAMPKNWRKIADESKVPYKTIYKIAYRSTNNPRANTLDALYEYFSKQESELQSASH